MKTVAGRTVAVVPARAEAGRIGDTVRAIRTIPEVDDVVVVVNGPRDGTAEEANAAGARILIAPEGLGKGDAVEGALRRIAPADYVLFLDGDLGASAKHAAELLGPVLAGRADLAVAVFPRDPRHGGFGLMKRLARALIRATVGLAPAEPLSGQRAATRAVVDSVRPLAAGFGMEVGMTIDAVRAGHRLLEVPVPMEHAFTGRNVRGFAHRARQGVDAIRAAVPRLLRLR